MRFREVAGKDFAGAVSPPFAVDVPEPHRIAIPPEAEGPPAVAIDKSVGRDLLSFLVGLPCETEESRDRRSALLSKVEEVRQEARQFAREVLDAKQSATLARMEGLDKAGRECEDRLNRLVGERGELNGPLRLAGETLGLRRAEYERAMAAQTESAFPTDQEKRELRVNAEQARVAYVEAEDIWHAKDDQARKLDADIAKVKGELEKLKLETSRLRAAIYGEPFADLEAGGLVSVPEA
jgi:hypothetical protein